MSSSILFGLSLLLPQDPPPVQPAAPAAPATRTDDAPYHVLQTFRVGGEGSWDYLTVDAEARRLYVPRSTRVLVLDADSGAKVGEIADTAGVHGVALAPESGKGFTSNGRADTVTVFDLKTLAVVKTIKTGKNPDALTFEPKHQRVYVGDGRSSEVTVIAADKLEVAGTVAIGGKPEAIVADADGNVFVNVEDTSEIVCIDPDKLTVAGRFKLAPGTGPSGLAIDPARHLLFSVCDNERMVVLDAKTGAVQATPAIGKRVDGAVFDPETGCALSANGEGTITVVATTGDKPYTILQTLKTAAGARTIAYDGKKHRVYLPTAEFEAPTEASGGGRRQRPTMKPETFQIVVVGK